MDAGGARRPDCPSCGKPMRFARAVPRFASLPELRTYNCKRYRVTVNGSGETERAARWSEGRAASLGSRPEGR